jgi:hypothetical protein
MHPQEILIITGLPRSGTSLMMQMLHAAGMPILADSDRAADANNPRGYFEWQPALSLPAQPCVLTAATGKAVKILTPLLPYLPPGLSCRFLFMRRPLPEVARSQHAMRSGTCAPGSTPESMIPALQQHLDASLALLARMKLPVLQVDYPDLVAHPTPWAETVLRFIGSETLPHPERLTQPIDRALRRTV